MRTKCIGQCKPGEHWWCSYSRLIDYALTTMSYRHPYTQHIDLMFKALWVRTTALIQILFSKQSVLTSLLLDVNLTTELV